MLCRAFLWFKNSDFDANIVFAPSTPSENDFDLKTKIWLFNLKSGAFVLIMLDLGMLAKKKKKK